MPTRPAKDWQDRPSVATPLDAAGLEDLEDRLFGYSEQQLATRDIPVPGASEDGFVPIYDHGTLAYVWTGVATSTTVDDAVAAHNADTTSVHGIADTSTLLTASSAAGGDVSGTLSNLQLGSGVVTATEVNASLKPSGSAATTDESLRRLGTASSHAAAGDDSRFPSSGQKNALAGTNGTPGTGNEYVTTSDSRMSDTRTPTDGSVTDAKVNASAAIASSKLADGSLIPSSGQKDALAGTSGTPGSSNPYATKATTDGLQPLDADLTAIAALASAANKVPYATGSGTWALTDFTSAGRALVDDTDATAQRTTLDVYSKAESDFWIASVSITKATLDAKGDLVVATANDTPARLAVGSNGQALVADSAQSAGVKWSTQLDRDQGKAGIYAPLGTYWTFSASAVTSNRLYCNRFVPSRDMAITSMSFLVPSGASGTNDNVEMGIYSVASASSLTKVQTTGTITPGVNSTGLKTGNLTATANLTAGTVYYAVITLTSTVTCWQANFGTNGGGSFIGSTFTTGVDSLVKDSTGPGLGTTISSISTQPGTSVLLGLRE